MNISLRKVTTIQTVDGHSLDLEIQKNSRRDIQSHEILVIL